MGSGDKDTKQGLLNIGNGHLFVTVKDQYFHLVYPNMYA